MKVSRVAGLIGLAIALNAHAGPPAKKQLPGLSSPFQNGLNGSPNLNNSAGAAPSRPPTDDQHAPSASAGGSLTGPFRWVCVGSLKAPVKGQTVATEIKGSMNASCDEAERKTLESLGQAKALANAGNSSVNPVATPVKADDANVYCRKEDFLTSCQ